MNETKKVASGAFKRKKRREDLEKLKKMPNISNFFKKSTATATSSSTNEVNTGEEDSYNVDKDAFVQQNEDFEDKGNDKEEEASVQEDEDGVKQQDTNMDVDDREDNNNTVTSGKIEENRRDSVIGGDESRCIQQKENISTDMGNFKGKVLTDEIRRNIISTTSCKPKGPFPKDPLQNNRHFSETYFSMSSKYGKVERFWLCYSAILDATYCEPCWLFSNSTQDQWRSGIRDWQNLSKKIKLHGNSASHIQACSIYDLWKKNETVDKELEANIRYEATFWRMVLERLFNITLTLSNNSLAFRGHVEQLGKEYNGNFLSLVELLSKYDEVMKQVVNMPKGSVKYLSPKIQNEIIECLADHLQKALLSEIKSSPFYACIFDTTQDISKKDQMSLVIRYVHIQRNESSVVHNFQIKETFLGFHEVKDHTAQGMTDQILNIFEQNSIEMEKCRGQGYDGASVMSGVYNGVQAKMKLIQPNAPYVHCASHNLNLVINDAVSGCKEVDAFFAVLQSIYCFFGNSIKRWDLLAQFTGESEVTIKKLNPTRWSSRINSLIAVKLRYVDILKALTEIALKSTKRCEREEAKQIKEQITRIEFVFMCVKLCKILSEINYASKTLQKQDLDLYEANETLNCVKANLKDCRLMYETFKRDASEIATKWGVVPSFTEKRQRKVKRQFSDLVEDYRFLNVNELFKATVFNCTMDIVNTH